MIYTLPHCVQDPVNNQVPQVHSRKRCKSTKYAGWKIQLSTSARIRVVVKYKFSVGRSPETVKTPLPANT